MPTIWGQKSEQVACEGIEMDEILNMLQNITCSDSKVYLTIANSNLTTLPREFLGDIKVTGLKLKLPNLGEVNDDAFMGQESTMMSLAFHGSSLSYIPVKSFSRIVDLKYFEFINTSKIIENITSESFAALLYPQSFRILKFDNIGLKSVGDYAFSNFTNMYSLYLDNNELTELNANSVPPMKLHTLELNGNKFGRIPSNLFSIFRDNAASRIDLSNNGITTIPVDIIKESLKKSITVDIHQNDLNCDCAFKPLVVKLLESPYYNTISGRCVLPEKLNGTEVRRLSESDFSDCFNSRLLTAGVILSCIAGIAFAASPPQIPCEDDKYFPCKCQAEFQWSADVDAIKCDGIAMHDVVKVVQNVKAKSKNRIYVTIINQNLTSLPQKVFEDVLVQGATFQLPSLRNVDDNAFVGQDDSLETLSFDGCSLPSIPTKSVSILKKLTLFEYVNSKVKIGNINHETFAGMGSAANIEQLRLGNNGIKSIGRDALKVFTNSNYLYLNDNELSYVSADSFPARKLDVLKLNGNKFSQIPVNLFSNLNKNANIDLRDNKISRVTGKVLKLNNKLKCDCKFKLLEEYIEEHPDGNTISGKCVWPKKLENKDVFDLKLSDFSNCPDSDCFLF
ncbi:Leucine-rich repeat transmembrane protein FLRT3 [Nymphon striatum]|nr:Leucine-rich repeat transmembrane protein FLRT3 [Nymphon striatum]